MPEKKYYIYNPEVQLQELLTLLFELFALLGLVGVIISSLRSIEFGLRLGTVIQWISYLTILVSIFILKNVQIKNHVVIACILTYSLGGLYSWGLAGQALVLLVWFPILIILATEMKFAFLYFTFTFVSILIIALGFVTNQIKLTFEIETYLYSLNAWVTAIITLLFTSSSTMYVLFKWKNAWLQNYNLLLNREKNYREIFNNIPVGIFQASLNGVLRYANPELIKMAGFESEEEMKTQKLSDLYVNESDKENIWDLLNTRGSFLGYEVQLYDKERKVSWYSLSETIVTDENGDSFISGIIENISVRKESEKALQQAKDAAEDSEKLKTEFLAQMSHEIRSPINAILSFTELLKMDYSHDKNEETSIIFDSIENAGSRIIRTIDLILNMSQIQTETYDFNPKSINLNKIIEHLHTQNKLKAKNKGIEFEFNAPLSPTIVFADEYSVSQVFDNLINNAIKYTNSGYITIDIESDIENNEICVSIKDSGIGMSDDYLKKIFAPFSQEEVGYTRKYDGNGLGLALVKKYCELNKASIVVESEKGTGTIVSIIFHTNKK